MILPDIYGNKSLQGKFFYFGCDTKYFEEYGKILANSLKIHAPWAVTHCHIFNPTSEQLDWCKAKGVSVSYEYIDPNIREANTYYACVRFIRIPEIFDASARIIALDCDSVAVEDLPEMQFTLDTSSTKVFWRTKGNKSLASTVLFGPDNTRTEYAEELKKSFADDSYKWFLDQDVMDKMISENRFGTTTDTTWGTTAPTKKKGLIWTGKGEKKLSQEFQNMLERYK